MKILDTKYTFKRFEKKYILTPEQYNSFMESAMPHLVPSLYHRSLVMSIYYDTDNYSLIRHSIEGPAYKEKLRVRSYGVPGQDDEVFVELKKKYKGLVFKRRVGMSAERAEAWLSGTGRPPEETQITREIDWFLSRNKVKPCVFIGCDRTSWNDRDNPELRFTFDSSIRWRDSGLSLTEGSHGTEQLRDGNILMEIKIPDSAPLWLAQLLSSRRIFPGSYSKFGTYYINQVIQGE